MRHFAIVTIFEDFLFLIPSIYLKFFLISKSLSNSFCLVFNFHLQNSANEVSVYWQTPSAEHSLPPKLTAAISAPYGPKFLFSLRFSCMTAKFDINVVQEKEKKTSKKRKGQTLLSSRNNQNTLCSTLRSCVCLCVFAHLSKNHTKIRDDLIVGAFVRKKMRDIVRERERERVRKVLPCLTRLARLHCSPNTFEALWEAKNL